MKKNKNKESTGPNLGDDALSNIFFFINVEILRKTMRKVCTQWRKLIENPIFIKQHYLNSDLVLLKEIYYDFGHSKYAYSSCNIRNNRTRAKHVVIETNNDLQLPGKVTSSVDGLLMFSDSSKGLLYVSNPVTKEVVELPQPPSILYTRHQVMIVPVFSAVEYKLVSCYSTVDLGALYVYTTSVGKQDELWRRIQHNYPNDVGGKIPEQFTVSAIPVEGVLFWGKHNCSNVISLNIKREKFVEFTAPAIAIDVKKENVYYIKMKNKLSCVHKKYSWHLAVYLAEESKKNGIFEWSKTYEIYWSWGCFVPFAWDGNGKVLLLVCKCKKTEANSEIVALNVVSKSSCCFSFSGVKTPGYSWQLPHVDTLVSLASLNY